MDVSGTIRAILNQKSREVFSISSDATVFEAVKMMDAKNVGALLVMKQARLVGVISERDYTRKVVLRGKRSRETKVAEIMSTNVFTTNPSEGVEECLRIMTDKHIRHLPVLDGDKVVGVISIGDLVKHVISCQQAAIAHLENYIHGGCLGWWWRRSPRRAPRRLTQTPLHLPNCFAAHDGPHCAAFEFPAVEWRIARGRLKLIDADSPFKFRIDQGYVSSRANR
jgi:CBS domain-containing protein